MKKEKPELTWTPTFMTLALVFGITYWIGGLGWAIGVSIVAFFMLLQIMYEEYKVREEKKKASNTQYGNEYTTSTVNPTYRKPSQNKIIDTIQFEYTPNGGELDTYTVDVTKGINGNIEGWCHEREAPREFRKDRIKNSEITRLETGELLTVKEWRKAMMKK